ncbi:anti-repressor SinI family protein [Bacillus sp. E214]|nr:anti-repressor SinI family protein [Bacillus sp. E214]
MCTVKAELDQEWVNLILIARQIGFTKEEIRSFIEREGNAQE